MSENLVFTSCVTCQTSAIYVPCVGPMGDEFHASVEEAIASGKHWRPLDGEFMCPSCEAFGERTRLETELEELCT